MISLPFRPLGNRVVIKADVEDHAPEQTASGLLTATSLAAAVEGSDKEDSWFVGTIVAIGPLVKAFSVRAFITKRLFEAYYEGRPVNALLLARELSELPIECPDPVRVGDRVTFSWASGQQITADGEKYLIMRDKDVLAVLEEANG